MAQLVRLVQLMGSRVLWLIELLALLALLANRLSLGMGRAPGTSCLANKPGINNPQCDGNKIRCLPSELFQLFIRASFLTPKTYEPVLPFELAFDTTILKLP